MFIMMVIEIYGEDIDHMEKCRNLERQELHGSTLSYPIYVHGNGSQMSIVSITLCHIYIYVDGCDVPYYGSINPSFGRA